MAKQNPMLAKIEAAAELKYLRLFEQKMSLLLKVGQCAAMVAANEVLHMGPTHAMDFNNVYVTTTNEIFHMMSNDLDDDPEYIWTKAKIDERIKSIVGEKNFTPWDEW